MANPTKIEKSVQEMQNLGFDVDFNLPTIEQLVHNPTNSTIDRMVQPAVGIITIPYDYVALTQATLTDTYVFKKNGAGGTTVATVVITYTDSGKGTISTVVKT